MGLSMFRPYTIAILAALTLLGCDKTQDLVVDEAMLFTSGQAENVATFHQYLQSDHDIDYRVMTIAKNVDLNRYTTEQFESQQVGSASKGGRGLLLVLDTKQNKVRLEVSRALEAVYPDAFVAYIEQRQMTPFFAAGRVADGVLATTEMIVTRAQHAQQNQGWDDEAWAKAATSGGGATAPARLDEVKNPKESDISTADNSAIVTPREKADAVIIVSSAPESTLQAYFKAMSERNASPELNIYTAQTLSLIHI